MSAIKVDLSHFRNEQVDLVKELGEDAVESLGKIHLSSTLKEEYFGGDSNWTNLLKYAVEEMKERKLSFAYLQIDQSSHYAPEHGKWQYHFLIAHFRSDHFKHEGVMLWNAKQFQCYISNTGTTTEISKLWIDRLKALYFKKSCKAVEIVSFQRFKDGIENITLVQY